MEEKKDIRNTSAEELQKFCTEHKLPKFRAKQIQEWLWKKKAVSFDEMTSLSKPMRDLFAIHFIINAVKIHKGERSIDGTIKYSLQLHDKLLVEGVLIPSKNRLTACVSSQVGCSLACEFCATGTLKLARNLTAAEIYDQVFILNQEAISNFGKPLSNIVYMGMGEPLLNYKNTLRSVEMLCSDKGMGISPRRITVSTAGIAKMIRKLGDDEVRFNLALSLHAANDEKRNKLMEINETNNLEELSEALIYFHEKTGTRVTFEYIIFKDFNDEIEDAQELAQFCKCVPCKINIIEYNPIDDGQFQQADPQKVIAFANFLETKNLIVNVRRSRGKDIDAACGQLANKNKAISLQERVLK